MDASELGRWTRFASKGGISKCTVLQDCIAERVEDLMFMKGYCEGVVDTFHSDAVRLHGRLKKPVLTKRQSIASPDSSPSSAQSVITVAARDILSPATSYRCEAGEITKQPSTDSPIEHPDSPDPMTSWFPLGDRPISRGSSVCSDESYPRVSVALSDNGVGNIGPSLLQGFVQGDSGSSSDDSDDEGQFATTRHVPGP